MAYHTIIDGNNLLFALRNQAVLPAVGRETLVRIVERWAEKSRGPVTLVFDGAGPGGGLARQMSSDRIEVVFAAPRTADDVIVDSLNTAHFPDRVRVVTDDTAIAHEARARKCEHHGCVRFIRALMPPSTGKGSPDSAVGEEPASDDKPEKVAPDEVERWVEYFEEEEGPVDDQEFR